ncbi:MAG: hypothetical protein VSS75_007540 [Candidatus Parabeggiatoa sp.]|nr:hypothetical protein [Candidatus Parabeggiatoa sp.]
MVQYLSRINFELQERFMTTLTIVLPESLTQQLQTYHISKQQLRVAVTDFIQGYIRQCQSQPQASTDASYPPDVATTLSELDSLEDQDLWHIVHTAMDRVDLVTMETLSANETHLNQASENQAQELLDRYDHAVLIRAKAIALLKKRGHDISLLQQSHFTQ